MKFKCLALFFLFATSLAATAQQNGMVRFDVLATKLEATHHIKLYYKPAWFEDKLFKETMAELSLDDCLAILKRSVHLDCLQFQPNQYVLVPEEVRSSVKSKIESEAGNHPDKGTKPNINIRLREVVINDLAADLNVVSSQMSTVKLNAKAIKELPLFLGEKDVLKSLKLLSGVQSTGEFGTGFFVRGGSQDQNLLLVEDVPLFNSAHAFGLISALNSDGINNITLLKSGIPANYGERASSVMDIRMGSNPDKTAVKGGIGLMDTRLNLETPLLHKKVNLLVGARTSYSNWLLHQMPDADLKNSSVRFFDLNALFNVKINPSNKLVLFGYFSDDQYSLNNENAYHYENLLGSVQYLHAFNEKLNATWMAGMSRYKNDLSESDTLAPREAFQIHSAIHYYNTKLHFNWTPSEVHTLDFGLNAVRYIIQPGIRAPLGSFSEVVPKSVATENGLEMAAYLSDKIQLFSLVGAEVGLRLSQYANLGATTDWTTSLEPRLSLRFTLDESSSLKLNFNRMSQFINLLSNTTVMSPTDVYKLSSRNTKPVLCDQVGLGYFRNFKDNALEASAEIYFKKLRNILEYKDGAELLLNDNLESDLLNASGYNYGLELSLKKNTGRLTGWANYTYSRSLRHTSGILKDEQINGNRYYPSGSDQPHNIVLVGNYHLTRRWLFSGIFNYSTGRPVTLPELKYEFDGKQYIYYSDRNKYRLPDYHRLDIALTHDENLRLKRSWKGSWTFAVLNLYARKNPYSVYYKSTANLESTFRNAMNLYKLYIIEKPIPTITYNFTF
jgi:hypothetical protein